MYRLVSYYTECMLCLGGNRSLPVYQIAFVPFFAFWFVCKTNIAEYSTERIYGTSGISQERGTGEKKSLNFQMNVNIAQIVCYDVENCVLLIVLGF